MLHRTALFIITLTLLGLAGSAQAGDIVVHEDWGGIWDLDLEFGLCGLPGQQSSEIDTLCSGYPFEPEDSDIELQCTGSWGSTVVDITCEGSTEIYADCLQTVTMEYDATRTGDSYGVTLIINTTHTGTGCVDETDFCFEENTTGDRTGPEPSECDATPTQSVSWSAIKVRYR